MLPFLYWVLTLFEKHYAHGKGGEDSWVGVVLV